MAEGNMGGMMEETEEPAEEETAAEDGGGEGEAVVTGPILPIGGFSSPHPGGSQFAFGDGHVEFLTESINQKAYRQMGSRADGELISGWNY